MIMPLVSLIQLSFPLVGHVAVGDILVFKDGKSMAELSHSMLTKMLNGGVGGNAGGRRGRGDRKGKSGSDEGRTLGHQ